MSKRLLGTAIFAVLLGAFFFALTLAVSGQTGSAGHASAAMSSSLGNKAQLQPNGIWEDVAPFPTVSVSPTPGTYPLRLKRAAAAAYPPNGKIYLMGGRHGTD